MPVEKDGTVTFSFTPEELARIAGDDQTTLQALLKNASKAELLAVLMPMLGPTARGLTAAGGAMAGRAAGKAAVGAGAKAAVAPVAGAAGKAASKTLLQKVISPAGIATGLGVYALSGAVDPLREGIKDTVGELTGRNEKLRTQQAAMKDLDQQNAMELAETNVRGNTAAEKIKLSQRQAELDADVTKQAIAQQNIMPNMVADINRYTAQGISYLPSVPVDIYAAIGVSPLNIQQMQQSASVAGQQANSP